MKRLLQARGAGAVVVGILVVLAAGGSYALASGSGTIHACVHKGSHFLYTGKCHKRDTKLSWNIQGPQGPKGDRGLQGPKGDTGSPGPAGLQSVSTGWTYPVAAHPQSDGHVAKFTFTAPASGFEVVSADFGVRVHNTSLTDCHVESQLATAPAVLTNIQPGTTNQPGFVDSWINGNLPTENGAGTYLELQQSVSRVFPVSAGANTVYLNGTYAPTGSACADALWGPITVTAVFANQNDSSATLTAP